MKRKRTRVVIPHKILDIATLINRIFEKHTTDGIDSPLKLIAHNADVDSFKERIEAAMEHHKEAERLYAEMEQQYALRDIWLKPLVKEVRVTAQFLKSLKSNNNKELGEWGYEVNDSRPPKKKKVVVKGS
jgi:rubrerythrin